MRQKHYFQPNTVCSEQKITPKNKYFTRIISLHPWQIACLLPPSQLPPFNTQTPPGPKNSCYNSCFLVFRSNLLQVDISRCRKFTNSRNIIFSWGQTEDRKWVDRVDRADRLIKESRVKRVNKNILVNRLHRMHIMIEWIDWIDKIDKTD